jgi:hypothetical protein
MPQQLFPGSSTQVEPPEDNCFNFKGRCPESWHCVDCGMNTAPGMLGRADMEKAAEALGDKWLTDEAGIDQTWTADTELFTVREAVWKAAGMAPMGGCLCIRCLEKRLGRKLRPKDFQRGHPFNNPRMPGTALRAARLTRGKQRGLWE